MDSLGSRISKTYPLEAKESLKMLIPLSKKNSNPKCTLMTNKQ